MYDIGVRQGTPGRGSHAIHDLRVRVTAAVAEYLSVVVKGCAKLLHEAAR
ncbi:putative transposable element encoded protein [Trachipleistophora hominis]|uniref:Putative transposable element encoded protein n=1 Tax=Trachipleistophora hominis TaxID=72359 RepID=L7JSR3_TRAHO|nr:putative transposable element encoded protein [Trachipleistophora hominis]